MIVKIFGEAFEQLDLAGDLSGEQNISVGGNMSVGNVGFDATGLGIIRELTSEFDFGTLSTRVEDIPSSFIIFIFN